MHHPSSLEVNRGKAVKFHSPLWTFAGDCVHGPILGPLHLAIHYPPPPPAPRAVLKGGVGVWGLGPKKKFCVPKMARQVFPSCKFRFFPRWSLWSWGGGSPLPKKIKPQPAPPLPQRPALCYRLTTGGSLRRGRGELVLRITDGLHINKRYPHEACGSPRALWVWVRGCRQLIGDICSHAIRCRAIVREKERRRDDKIRGEAFAIDEPATGRTCNSFISNKTAVPWPAVLL